MWPAERGTFTVCWNQCRGVRITKTMALPLRISQVLFVMCHLTYYPCKMSTGQALLISCVTAEVISPQKSFLYFQSSELLSPFSHSIIQECCSKQLSFLVVQVQFHPLLACPTLAKHLCWETVKSVLAVAFQYISLSCSFPYWFRAKSSQTEWPSMGRITLEKLKN